MVDTAGILICAFLLLLLGLQQSNLQRFVRVAAGGIGGERPSVSVLIPARDEQRNIESVVRSIAADPAATEILVLDDHSSDATPAIVTRLATEIPHLRLLEGQALPNGWRGKNWACHQLASEARGQFFLFTDADTVHRGSVSAALAEALRGKDDLLSLMPRQLTGTLAERLTIPLMDFFFLTFFPAFMLQRGFDPRFAAANGQFLLFRRSAYDQIGGHASVRNSVVDDLALARRIREERLQLRISDGAAVVSCRMYRSAGEIREGFSKNLFAALGGTRAAAFGIGSLMLLLFVLPLLLAPFHQFWLVALLIGLLLRLRTDWRAGHPLLWALFHPISILASVLLLARSVVLTSSGGTVWKGRPVQLGGERAPSATPPDHVWRA